VHEDSIGAIAIACSAIVAAGPGLVAVLQSMKEALSAPELSGLAHAPLDAAALAGQLQALCMELSNSDMAATERIGTLQQQVSGPAVMMLQPIADAIHALEFERALQLCRPLMTGTPA